MPRFLFIVSLLIALFLPQGRAQFQSTFINNYFTIKTGPNYYYNHFDGSVGLGLDINYGKWMINTASLRTQLSAQLANKGKSSGFIVYAHEDVLLDIISSIKGRNKSRFRSYFILGMGLAHCNGDNDFCGLVGVGGDCRISDDWRLTGELSSIIYPSDFDHNSTTSFLPSLTFGLQRDINYNPTRSRSREETRQFGYDWFFQVGVGVSSLNYSGIGSFKDRVDLLMPAFEFGVGKMLTNIWSVRIDAAGLYARSHDERFSYYTICGDMILDMAGWLASAAGRTLFDFKPYAGAGILTRLDDQSHFLFGMAAGAIVSFRPDPKNEVFIYGRYVLTPPRFVHVKEDQTTFSVGVATLMLGYSYIFSRNSF